MFCKVCGQELVGTAVICIKCGSPIQGSSNVTHDRKFIMWGWVTAFILPLLGIILGIYNTVKGEVSHGIGQVVVSIGMWAFWSGFFSAF